MARWLTRVLDADIRVPWFDPPLLRDHLFRVGFATSLLAAVILAPFMAQASLWSVLGVAAAGTFLGFGLVGCTIRGFVRGWRGVSQPGPPGDAADRSHPRVFDFWLAFVAMAVALWRRGDHGWYPLTLLVVGLALLAGSVVWKRRPEGANGPSAAVR